MLKVSAQACCQAQRPTAPAGCHFNQPAGPLQHFQHAAVVFGTAALLGSSFLSPSPSYARSPPIQQTAGRCDVAALDKFADTRKTFSQEASGGNMIEALVDVRECDFSNMNLSGKVLSGVQLQNSNFANTQLVGSEMARANAQGANLSNVNFLNTNAYGTNFNGADLSGATFENSILTNASFGKDATGTWANLKGTQFEGALISSSDVERICENPTLLEETRKFELGCRKGR